MADVKVTVRRHLKSGEVRSKTFDEFQTAEADYELAADDRQVERCEFYDHDLKQVTRHWLRKWPHD